MQSLPYVTSHLCLAPQGDPQQIHPTEQIQTEADSPPTLHTTQTHKIPKQFHLTPVSTYCIECSITNSCILSLPLTNSCISSLPLTNSCILSLPLTNSCISSLPLTNSCILSLPLTPVSYLSHSIKCSVANISIST